MAKGKAQDLFRSCVARANKGSENAGGERVPRPLHTTKLHRTRTKPLQSPSLAIVVAHHS